MLVLVSESKDIFLIPAKQAWPQLTSQAGETNYFVFKNYLNQAGESESDKNVGDSWETILTSAKPVQWWKVKSFFVM